VPPQSRAEVDVGGGTRSPWVSSRQRALHDDPAHNGQVGDAAAPIVLRPQALVGRGAEFAVIEAFTARLADVACGVVVRGEPGIGKTALWREGVALLRGAGHRVLICRPAEEEMSLAAGGLADLLEGTNDDPAALRAIDDPLVRGRMVLKTLRTLVREGPVVVAIDDAQWLDSV
jgi:hypothetical protein